MEGVGASAFEVEPTLLHYTRAVGNYTQKLGALKAVQKSMVGEEVHFWRTGGTHQDALGSLNFRGHGEMLTTHPCWTNAQTNIDHIPVEEKVVALKENGSCRRAMLRLEHKNFSWMKDMVRPSHGPLYMLVYNCKGGHAVAIVPTVCWM